MKIGGTEISNTLLLTGIGVAVFLFFGPQISGWLARKTASAAGGVIVQGATGAVIGIGESVGIPPTDVDKCHQYIQAGDYWNASFYCPAGTFLKAATGAIFNPKTGEQVGQTQPGQPDIITMTPAGT
jgi:hypothetical protein